MEEAGLAEAVWRAVEASPPQLHGLLYSNVLLIGACAGRIARLCALLHRPPSAHCLPTRAGGTTRCPGFKERLHAELRPLVPDDYEVCAVGVLHARAPPPTMAMGAVRPATPQRPRSRSQLNVHAVDDPVLCAAQGACLLARSPDFAHGMLGRQEWQQRGVAAYDAL